jgi:hypothetical protein
MSDGGLYLPGARPHIDSLLVTAHPDLVAARAELARCALQVQAAEGNAAAARQAMHALERVAADARRVMAGAQEQQQAVWQLVQAELAAGSTP